MKTDAVLLFLTISDGKVLIRTAGFKAGRSDKNGPVKSRGEVTGSPKTKPGNNICKLH